MTVNGTPLLDERNAQAFAAALLHRLPGYVPGWYPREGQPGWAIIQAYARYLHTLAERLNLAPDKNKLAFLELLGINLLPAQASRAPVVFKAMPQVGDGRIPIRTQVGAAVAGLDEPLIFETEQAIALASAQLAEVVTLWPGKDAYADHSQAALGGQPFTLFEPLQPVPHELYLAHDTYFALSGQATVELQVELARPGSQPLPIIWEYWDGDVWRMFKPFQPVIEASLNDSLDGTDGLTRSGLIRLVADCAETKKTTIDGLETYWLRGRVTQPITPAPGLNLPLINTITIRTTIANPLKQLIPTPVTAPAGEVNIIFGLGGSQAGLVELFGPNDFHAQQQLSTGTTGWSSLAAGRYKLIIIHPAYAPFEQTFTLFSFAGKTFRFSEEITGFLPDAGYADSLKLDLEKSFYPFGQQPQPGTSFYFSSAEAFSKPGARMRLKANKTDTAIGSNPGTGAVTSLSKTLNLEYWNGNQWQPIMPTPDNLVGFVENNTELTLTVPDDLEKVEVNGKEDYWLRLRLLKNTFGRTREIKWKQDGLTNTIVLVETTPPALSWVKLGYLYQSPAEPPQACITYNDCQWLDRTDEVQWQGSSFEPFSLAADHTPTLYLGFDKPLPADLISLYLDIQEVSGRTTGPVLKWEFWNGKNWLPLTIQDETAHLVLPGMVSVLWPGTRLLPTTEAIQASGTQIEVASAQQAARFQVGDLLVLGSPETGEMVRVAGINRNVITLKRPLNKAQTRITVSLAALPRFTRPRTWLRARLQSDGKPENITINGLFLNAVWAAQVRTIENEALGSSDGRSNQAFFCRQTPVLVGEIIEVRELSGPRAVVELPILQQELLGQGFAETDIRTVTDRRSGQITEVWVRWRPQPNLFFSGPDDRHYMVERSRGRIIFGDNVNGRIPLAGRDNIRARQYRSGGTVNGNVPTGAINQLLSGVVAEGVSNPRPAEGGAEGEPPEAARTRGPQLVRHRQQAVTLNDYEALAREASPAVAVARALPVTHASGRSEPGWVKLIIMPHSQEAQPQPSFGLRRQITAFLSLRTPAGLSGQLFVTGPDYLPVGVEAVITPRDLSSGGQVLKVVTKTLADFLHPLLGGPDGQGWPFGRDVYLSDIAAVLERIPEVDYVSTLNLLLDGTPRGERVDVPSDRIVVAGDLRLMLAGNEG
ncbi:MAG: putative baseplate assembly protein [Anaerolineae bacterium]|nr:putative baseplate assembly protein [Anaerolineae bacterium]